MEERGGEVNYFIAPNLISDCISKFFLNLQLKIYYEDLLLNNIIFSDLLCPGPRTGSRFIKNKIVTPF